VEDIKYIIVKTIDAVKRKLDPNNRNGCFELFGYDFMLDDDLTVWLIEANTNPCLDETSDILKRILPRMLDDAFRLTIDREFPNPLISQKTKLENFLRNNDKQASFLKNYGDNIKRYIKLNELKRKISNGAAKSSKVQAA